MQEVISIMRDGMQKEITELSSTLQSLHGTMAQSFSAQRQQVDQRLNAAETAISEVRGETTSTLTQSLSFARSTTDTINKEVNRLERVVGTLESYQQQQLDKMKKDISNLTQSQE